MNIVLFQKSFNVWGRWPEVQQVNTCRKVHPVWNVFTDDGLNNSSNLVVAKDNSYKINQEP